MKKQLLVVGAGVAGASVAHFARNDWDVTVIEHGHAASDVPAALVNPVRGQQGRVPKGGVEGMRALWTLMEALQAEGHAIPHGRTGIWRPVPSEAIKAKFAQNLTETDLDFAWNGLQLHLPEGGWLDGQAFTSALLTGASVVRGEVVEQSGATLRLASGEVLASDALVWCGGSLGKRHASQVHRAGTLLRLQKAPSRLLSFGAYLAPAARGGVLGATFEPPRQGAFSPPTFELSSLQWLLGKAAQLTDPSAHVAAGHWSGVRLTGERICRQVGPRQWELSGLGSAGFLLGPLLASRLVEEMKSAF